MVFNPSDMNHERDNNTIFGSDTKYEFQFMFCLITRQNNKVLWAGIVVTTQGNNLQNF